MQYNFSILYSIPILILSKNRRLSEWDRLAVSTLRGPSLVDNEIKEEGGGREMVADPETYTMLRFISYYLQVGAK